MIETAECALVESVCSCESVSTLGKKKRKQKKQGRDGQNEWELTFREDPRGLTHLKGLLASPSTSSSTFCLRSAASALLLSISSFILLFSSCTRKKTNPIPLHRLHTHAHMHTQTNRLPRKQHANEAVNSISARES